jgi:kinase suppressor of Ras 2
MPFHGPDSSSAGSSCNSSSPSSPALLLAPLPPQTPAASKHTQFNFPDVTNNHYHNHHGQHLLHHYQVTQVGGAHLSSGEPHNKHHHQSVGGGGGGGVTLETFPIEMSSSMSGSGKNSGCEIIQKPNLSNNNNGGTPGITRIDLSDTHRSNDSDEKTISLSGSTSTDSDRTPIRLDSTEERDSGHWPRQNSLSLKEWDIPYDDLMLLEKIGQGRFGTVHRALWHGDVAVKLLREDYLGDERTLEAFKMEVATFKKTRHENVVLFMGACWERLAIVTSLCKGNTLYTHIHLRKDKFNLNRTTLVAQQIAQGMGYLHARGIVHKDLKTKNIFLENGKVIITDFGLFSATKLHYCDLGLGIPSGWLCYLAPELIKKLRPELPPSDEDLPFSDKSDVYAFGTVWYELLCGEFPFKSQPPETIIWQVGRGMKQSLANIQATHDVKHILMLCWKFTPNERPPFSSLLETLKKLPKKRLTRSPSHPVQLSRSAESVF